MLVGNGKMSEIVDTIVQVLKVNYVMPGVVGGGCGPLVTHSITWNTTICSGMPGSASTHRLFDKMCLKMCLYYFSTACLLSTQGTLNSKVP